MSVSARSEYFRIWPVSQPRPRGLYAMRGIFTAHQYISHNPQISQGEGNGGEGHTLMTSLSNPILQRFRRE